MTTPRVQRNQSCHCVRPKRAEIVESLKIQCAMKRDNFSGRAGPGPVLETKQGMDRTGATEHVARLALRMACGIGLVAARAGSASNRRGDMHEPGLPYRLGQTFDRRGSLRSDRPGADHGWDAARHPRRDASQIDGLQRCGPFFFAASAADAPAVPLWCGRRAAESACCCDTFSALHAIGMTSNRCRQRGQPDRGRLKFVVPMRF